MKLSVAAALLAQVLSGCAADFVPAQPGADAAANEPPGLSEGEFPGRGPSDEPPPVVASDCPLCHGQSCDYDKDQLVDDDELKLGTNPCSPDTDADGLPDGLEVHGFTHPAPFGFVDYAKTYGTDPKVKDVLVEVDYHHYKDAKGNDHSARLSQAVMTHLKTYYASLQIPYPDGKKGGIHLVLVHDDMHPLGKGNDKLDPPGSNASHDCYLSQGDAAGDKSSSDFPEATFRKASLCIGQNNGGRGNGTVTGRLLKIISPETNNLVDGTADDEIEEANYQWYWLFIHEMGHTLGLLHGGNENINYKPNYPSVMNYRYDANLGDHARTLKDTRVGYSTGKLKAFPLNPCQLDEHNSFPGLLESDVRFLATGAGASLMRPYRVYPGLAGPAVDWNSNGVTDSALVEQVLTDPAVPCTGKSPGRLIRDVDDLSIIAKCMHGGIAASMLPIDPDCPK